MTEQNGSGIVVGTAGWSIPSRHAGHFPSDGSHLERYGARLAGVEINSSFYRPHRRSTYQRWAEAVPPHFRFAVKLPKAMTHERRLVDCGPLLDGFSDEVSGLGGKVGVVLVQLPPSLTFDAGVAERFFAALRQHFAGAVALEPRHAGWFTTEADGLLASAKVARVAADPPPVEEAKTPGGWDGFVYLRLHGAPRIYYSDYPMTALAQTATKLDTCRERGIPAWCIFDNTAAGHALGNALTVAG